MIPTLIDRKRVHKLQQENFAELFLVSTKLGGECTLDSTSDNSTLDRFLDRSSRCVEMVQGHEN